MNEILKKETFKYIRDGVTIGLNSKLDFSKDLYENINIQTTDKYFIKLKNKDSITNDKRFTPDIGWISLRSLGFEEVIKYIINVCSTLDSIELTIVDNKNNSLVKIYK